MMNGIMRKIEMALFLDARCEAKSPDEVADSKKHLNEEQKGKQKEALNECSEAFNDMLGHYPHEQISLELEEDSSPVHPQEETISKELKHPVAIDALQVTPHDVRYSTGRLLQG